MNVLSAQQELTVTSDLTTISIFHLVVYTIMPCAWICYTETFTVEIWITVLLREV